MNDYEITFRKGFSTRKEYASAECVRDVAKSIIEKLGFEISEGLRYEIKKL